MFKILMQHEYADEQPLVQSTWSTKEKAEEGSRRLRVVYPEDSTRIWIEEVTKS